MDDQTAGKNKQIEEYILEGLFTKVFLQDLLCTGIINVVIINTHCIVGKTESN